MPEPAPLQQLTVAMIVRDAADQLPGALESVRGLAATVRILDTGSTDSTAAKASEFAGVELRQRPDFPGFGRAKQEVLDLCTTDWIFFLDADERVDAQLAAAIRHAVEADDPARAGWRIRRNNHVLGRRMGSMGLDRDTPLRLFRRGAARVSPTLVHEVIEVDGPVGMLEGGLDHYSLTSLDSYLRKIDHYTTLELRQRPRPLRVWHLVLVGPGTFLKWYIFRSGWRDRVPGLVWAGLTAISRFMRDMKVWIAQQPGQDGTNAKEPPAAADDSVENHVAGDL
jgi:(heptosyl)LPS beta-1,4-glucosyltransferase